MQLPILSQVGSIRWNMFGATVFKVRAFKLINEPATFQGVAGNGVFMICEILDGVRFDIAKLRGHLEKHILPLAPVEQAKYFGGWSVLSSDGTYRDGWGTGHVCFKYVNGVMVFDDEKGRQQGVRPTTEYTYPTDICHGYMQEVIEQIQAMGLNPCRARVSLLKPGGATSLHRDAAETKYAVRLHIPIITNPLCTFESEGESVHMPADGSAYLVKVNLLHQAFNRSRENRYHLFMNIFDKNGLTKYNRMP